jgi:VCBS repeat-containing protein
VAGVLAGLGNGSVTPENAVALATGAGFDALLAGVNPPGAPPGYERPPAILSIEPVADGTQKITVTAEASEPLLDANGNPIFDPNQFQISVLVLPKTQLALTALAVESSVEHGGPAFLEIRSSLDDFQTVVARVATVEGSATYAIDLNLAAGIDPVTVRIFAVEAATPDVHFNFSKVIASGILQNANQPPVATDDSYSVDEDAALVVSEPGLLGNDSDGDGDLLGALLVAGPAHGTLVVGADGSFTYTPEPNFFGSDSFTYQATDGTEASNVAVVNITVDAVDDAPTLTTVQAFARATEDTPFVISYDALAAASDAADVDSPAVSFRIEAVTSGTLTKDGVEVIAGDTVLNAGEALVWTPAQDANGLLNAFTVTAFDGESASASAVQVQIQVAAVNDAPVANAGVDRVVRLASVVTLDGTGSFDPDNGPAPLTYSWRQTGGPSITLTGANTANPTFQPLAAGVYTFELVVNDGQASSVADSVTIQVPPLGDLDLDGDVDTDDLNILMAGRNTPATDVNDLRDLDGDGMITLLDARKLTLLYTRPRGATT